MFLIAFLTAILLIVLLCSSGRGRQAPHHSKAAQGDRPSETKAVYMCTCCVWRQQQMRTGEMGIEVVWAIVLAPDGDERKTLELLVVLRPPLGATRMDILLSFADLTPTRGYFHMSWVWPGFVFFLTPKPYFKEQET